MSDAGPTPAPVRRILRVGGAVQGVGFRPFVYRHARELGLCGAVWNEPDGVVVDVEGAPAAVAELRRWIELRPPPRARVESLRQERAEPAGQPDFRIRESAGVEAERARLVADLGTCAACLRELRDPADRRFGYPFLNCTDCGPRYSIVRELPYDRAHTTMDAFAMCEACAREYHDPVSRRFHAQPNACPACGPRVRLETAAGTAPDGEPFEIAVRALRDGAILALKGLGGFHLACDATSEAAVARLRERKHRPSKPFAVMFPSPAALAREAALSEDGRALLASPRAPILLLPLRPGSCLAAGLAPGLREVGALLPYTPLHHRLLARFGGPLVMTSGNRSDEPLAATDEEARTRLAGLADLWLLHDRAIHARVDDSVARLAAGAPRLLRRARGWVPDALPLPVEGPPLLAVGADLKNAFCLARGGAAVPSPHLGDLACFEVRQLFEETRARLEHLLQIAPELVVHDLHPGYQGTALAHATGLPRLAVQHHHAHVAACLAEHGRRGPVIGVAWDGTGYGPDGSVWGGEVLAADLVGYRRCARLRPVPLPGGEAAVRQPWRMAIAHLLEAGLSAERVAAPQHAAVEALVRQRLHAPSTSSAGRLFDAVAALTGVCSEASYEGEAAARLEAASERSLAPYPLPLVEAGALLELDPRPLVRDLVRDLDAGEPVARIGGRFHAALAKGMLHACRRVRDETGMETVALGGGCFQNRLLLEGAIARLEAAGFEVLAPAEVPAGDGGISLGQAAVAAATSAGLRAASETRRSG